MSNSEKFQFAPIASSEPNMEKAKSKLGSTSIGLAILAIILLALSVLLSKLDSMQQLPWQMRYSIRENLEIIKIIVNVLLCVTPLISITGIGLGIAACIRKDTNKKAGIIGLVLSILALLIPVCFIVFYFLVS